MQWLKKWLTGAKSDSAKGEIEWLSSSVARPPLHKPVREVEVPPVVARAPVSLPPAIKRPKTLEPELSNRQLNRPLIFDPALKHLNAYRAGEPCFISEEQARHWFAIREEVLLHALRTIAQSPAAEHLILRGSLLLAIWNRELARRPGDLDWVVTPDTWSMDAHRSNSLLLDVEESLRGSMGSWEIPFVVPDAPFVGEDIWCYEKSPGKRLIVPWVCNDPTLSGTIQMDFVFGEVMPSPPTKISFESAPGIYLEVQAATPAQSLAWKLLWLETDMHCQGKDLYDAVVLAEATQLDKETFARTFEIADTKETWRGFTANSIRNWHVEWKHFQNEYPQIEGSADDWKNRLITALSPLFEQLASWRHKS